MGNTCFPLQQLHWKCRAPQGSFGQPLQREGGPGRGPLPLPSSPVSGKREEGGGVWHLLSFGGGRWLRDKDGGHRYSRLDAHPEWGGREAFWGSFLPSERSGRYTGVSRELPGR